MPHSRQPYGQPSGWVMVIIVLVVLLIIVAKITYRAESSAPVVQRCVVLPLRGGGGMVTDCQPERRP